MALNTLSFASKFTGELDKIVTAKAATGFFADNVFRSKFVGAKTVIVPDIDFVGLADYDRDNGFAKGATTISQQSYALTKDRGRQLQLDREDLDETGVANLAGQVLGEFVRTKVVPEVDAYTLSKLAGVAKAQSHSYTEGTGDKYYADFIDRVNSIRAAAGYDEEMVAFVDSSFYAGLVKTSEITRSIVVSDFKQGDVNLRVKSIDGVAIIPVPDSRMKTAYTFGSNGFTAAESAKSIRLLVMPKKSASLVKKTETMRIFTPEQNKDADAYAFNYRLYYDVFVKKSNLGFIEAIISA